MRVVALLLPSLCLCRAQSKMGPMSRIDHLVYTTPDLARGIDAIERLLGVRATPGGPHPNAGTRNALVALGPSVYLEIIGPDPEQPPPPAARPFRIDRTAEPRLYTWAVKSAELDRLTKEAARQGVDLGGVQMGGRQRPDGVRLSWQRTRENADPLIPFFIDWGTTPHPAATAATGARLVELRAEHPDPQRIERDLRILGLTLSVRKGESPALIALIECPRGRVELR